MVDKSVYMLVLVLFIRVVRKIILFDIKMLGVLGVFKIVIKEILDKIINYVVSRY